eukprot:6849514-Alexandrium_andersonii.AAC.1
MSVRPAGAGFPPAAASPWRRERVADGGSVGPVVGGSGSRNSKTHASVDVCVWTCVACACA